MPDKSDIFEKPSVERLVTGGTYVLVFGLLNGLLGWAFTAIASQESIGVGGDKLGFLVTATAFQVIAIFIAAGFHQALSKYISESLVESKEKALKYAKAGFLIFNVLGLISSTIFVILAVIAFQHSISYGLLFGTLAIVFYLNFFKDNFIGNLAGVHRFDYIGKILFKAGVISIAVAFGILFLVPDPYNAYLLPLLIVVGIAFQIVFIFRSGKKVLPYSLSSTFRGAQKKELVQLIKYGLYCLIPNILFTGLILVIQNLYYIGLFSPGNIIVTYTGLIIGYASIVFSACQFGWPQIPAISEAKAKNDPKLIDDYMKSTLHNGFNISAFFLVIYVGLSYTLLYIFHGPEYLFPSSPYVVAHWPFVILSVAVGILGIEFLICTLLIGLGKGKQASLLITSLVAIQIVLVPILIIYLKSAFLPEVSLYAGPTSLLISAIATFPLAFRYLKRNTSNPTKVYTDILWKGTVSIVLTLTIYIIIDLTFFSSITDFMMIIVLLIVRASILIILYMIFMVIFAGFTDKDLDVYKFMGPIVKGLRWILHHSPFYKPEEEEPKEDGVEIGGGPRNGI